jgi:hypothetical protein
MTRGWERWQYEKAMVVVEWLNKPGQVRTLRRSHSWIGPRRGHGALLECVDRDEAPHASASVLTVPGHGDVLSRATSGMATSIRRLTAFAVAVAV